MYRTQCVLAFLALYMGLAHCFSWEIVLGGVKQLEFYDNNGILTHTEAISCNITGSIAYDPVHNRVLFVEIHEGYKSISSFDIATRKIEYLFRCEVDGNIRITFDPATQLLFWVNSYSRNTVIRSTLIKPGSNYAVHRNLVMNFDDKLSKFGESPLYLAVDSCGGYIYWTSATKIERARFDGSERKLIIRSSDIWRHGITIDQQTQKMYWADKHYFSFLYGMSIESADFNGENRRTVFIETGYFTEFDELAVSKDFVYWRTSETIWQLPKNSTRDGDEEPKTFTMPPYYISRYTSHNKKGLATNYKINEQSCETLKSLLPIDSVPSDYDSLNDSIVASVLCVHGTKVGKEARCECTPGYIGERCDVSVCHNYCVQGDCSVSAEGQPECRCNASYPGERCEENACHDYCLNNGVCSLNGKSEPVCECTGGYEGERCDVSICLNYCFQGECSTSAEGQPLCRCTAGYSGERCEVNVCHEYCLNNGVCSLNEASEPVCQCTGHYEGDRCNVSVCQNYCFYGDCSAGAKGQLRCSCYTGYSGERCELNACSEYCSKHGVCSLNMDGEPVCQCTGDYEGERCDVPVFLDKCIRTISLLKEILNTDLTSVTLGKGVKSTSAPTAV